MKHVFFISVGLALIFTNRVWENSKTSGRYTDDSHTEDESIKFAKWLQSMQVATKINGDWQLCLN